MKPEIVLAVAPSTPNTLQVAYERAKAYESACQQNLPYTSAFMSTLYSLAIFSHSVLGSSISNSNSDAAIDKLTDAFNKMLQQLQECQPSATGNFSRLVCYKCAPNSSYNLGPNFTLVVPNVAAANASNAILHLNANSSSASVNQQQEALQALLSLAANLPAVNNSNNREQNHQPSYVNIADVDVPFFATSTRTNKHRHKHQRKDDED
ncbi:hypothetical protein C2G38_2237040 [Gigaspora rosea]|uniref:Uncharacterized protein n=1 Tax=Gigaspora rosea TaxID=44941 RepID=A0A397TSG4_9GLOM|nr:hypothetical protein C2G38_2237040 [Gigaspora rosea]